MGGKHLEDKEAMVSCPRAAGQPAEHAAERSAAVESFSRGVRPTGRGIFQTHVSQRRAEVSGLSCFSRRPADRVLAMLGHSQLTCIHQSPLLTCTHLSQLTCTHLSQLTCTHLSQLTCTHLSQLTCTHLSQLTCTHQSQLTCTHQSQLTCTHLSQVTCAHLS
ncbi:unnamed protein product [Gadus morhua 'NCC']